MRRFSIRLRLTAWYVFLLALILAAFSLALFAALSGQLFRDLDERLRVEAGALETRVGQVELDEDNGRSAGLPSSDYSLRWLDASGREIYSTGVLRAAPIDSAALAAAARDGGYFRSLQLSDATHVRAYVAPLYHDRSVSGFLEVGDSLAGVETTQRNLAVILIVAVPATLALASFGGMFIADRALRPIDAITREAQRIGERHLDRRLNLDLPDDEVGRLARTFDAMLARLETAFQRQRQFTADASHELRTPLTVMKGNIGVTLNRSRTAGEYQSTLAQLEAEVDRLTRLTEDLLMLARADAGRPLIQPRAIDVAALAGDLVDQLRPLAEAKSLPLRLASPQTLAMHGDPERLRRMLSNLVENAIKYTSRGYVEVRVEPLPGGSQLRLSVEDTGPGIAPDHVPHVFERFYRVDESRSREQGGSGLGLAIAHSIATAHGGTIDIRGRNGGGTSVIVTLPIRPA